MFSSNPNPQWLMSVAFLNSSLAAQSAQEFKNQIKVLRIPNISVSTEIHSLRNRFGINKKEQHFCFANKNSNNYSKNITCKPLWGWSQTDWAAVFYKLLQSGLSFYGIKNAYKNAPTNIFCTTIHYMKLNRSLFFLRRWINKGKQNIPLCTQRQQSCLRMGVHYHFIVSK